MATNVIAAFNEFLRDKVNLDSGETDLAKRSRDWLMNRIHEFPAKENSFPRLYEENDIFFGSFERKTKKRPLDDIDIMVCMSAQGSTYTEWGNTIIISANNSSSPLYDLRHNDSNDINSKRVINKFVSVLSGIDQYKKAEISRRGEAAILNLQSYDWTFDIVPCFFTELNTYGQQFYIIPNGEGHWQKTDPRVDRSRVQRLVTRRGSQMLDVIRLVKFWNKRPTMPSVPSYTLENMVLDYYETRNCSAFPDLEFRDFIGYMASAIYKPVNDPKGYQGDLNTLDIVSRYAIANRCLLDYGKCIEARAFETAEEHKKSMSKWAEIFGPEFTVYG